MKLRLRPPAFPPEGEGRQNGVQAVAVPLLMSVPKGHEMTEIFGEA